MLEALIEAANSRELTIYQAGATFPHKPDGPLGALSGHEAYWSDLNAWLRAHKVQGDFAFPAPQEAAPAEQAATVAGPGTPAEQWEAARGDMKRRAALAVSMVKACQDNKAKAARRLGTTTGPLYRALKWAKKNAPASVAPSVAGVVHMYAQLAGKAHKN